MEEEIKLPHEVISIKLHENQMDILSINKEINKEKSKILDIIEKRIGKKLERNKYLIN